jgi:hypothetical protein
MTADPHLTQAIDLEFISGVRAPLALPPACGKANCYVFSIEYSGHAQFWQLMTQLLQAAGHSPCSVHDALSSQGADLAEVKRQLVSIANSTPSLGDQPPRHEQLDEKTLTELEKRLTGVRAPLGYASLAGS